MEFTDKVVIITGSASGIGQATKQALMEQGASVFGIDEVAGEFYQGDISVDQIRVDFIKQVLQQEQQVDILINNAPPLMKGIHDASIPDLEQALRVGVVAPFALIQLLLPHFSEKASIVNVTSTRAFMSQPETETYAAAKGGLTSMTHALAMSLAGKVRVNAIAPGWIDTTASEFSGADVLQHPVKRVGRAQDIAEMILYLSSEKASFITGQTIVIDGGMSRQMIYHGDHLWQFGE